MQIRMATRDDALAVQTIYAPIVAGTPISFEEDVPTVEEIADRIGSVLRTHPWLIATEAGRVAGYAYATAHRARAAYRWACDASVYVADDARGRGIATGLYRKLFSLLKAQGFLRVFAGVTVPNPASEALHRSVGFEPVGTYRRVGFKLGRWHDVRWFELSLGDSDSPREPIPFPTIATDTT